MLKVGQSETPFGLINVGDAAGLSTHIAERNFDDVAVLENEFSDTMFGQINDSSSPLNLLIGSKRFVEGWDCWRVSTLGLMHVGKSEGSQIIQLFGRGVRLKGHHWSLQRSGFSTPTSQARLHPICRNAECLRCRGRLHGALPRLPGGRRAALKR